MHPLLSFALVFALAFPLAVGASAAPIACVYENNQGDAVLVLVDSETGSRRTIGTGPSDGAPVWSPDGQWLAYSCATPEGRGIRVVGVDGSEGRVVSSMYPNNDFPAWSPEGRRLAYSGGDEFLKDLVVCTLGADDERVWGNTDIPLQQPAWLPDPRMVPALAAVDGEAVPVELKMDIQRGGLLAVGFLGATADSADAEDDNSPRKMTTELYVVTLRNAFPLPQAAMPSDSRRYVEWSPRPGPKGRAVVFESNDGGDRELFLATEKGAHDLTNHRAADWNPVWSPQGKWIAFESFRGGRRGVYRVHVVTSRVSTVAASATADFWAPAWDAKGKRLAYVSSEEAVTALIVQEIASGKTTRIAPDSGHYYAPAWRP